MFKYNKEIISLEFQVTALENKRRSWRNRPERNSNGFRDIERINKIGKYTREITKKKRSIERYEQLKALKGVKNGQ